MRNSGSRVEKNCVTRETSEQVLVKSEDKIIFVEAVLLFPAGIMREKFGMNKSLQQGSPWNPLVKRFLKPKILPKTRPRILDP